MSTNSLKGAGRARPGRTCTTMLFFATLGACAGQAGIDDDEKVVTVEVSDQGLITTAKLATAITRGLVAADAGVIGMPPIPGMPASIPTGKCFGVQSNRTDNGAPIVFGTCDGSVGQQWTLTEAGELKNPQSGRCLDVTGGANPPVDGTQLQLWDCTGASNQKWSFNQPGLLKSAASGKCAFVNPLAPDGTRVVVATCNASGGNGHAWVREFTVLKGDGSQRCLDMRAGNSAERAPVAIYDCVGGFNQSWFSDPAPSAPGADKIVTPGAFNGSLTFRCLTASGTASGSIATVEPCIASDLQRWRRTNSGRLVNVASNRCLEVASSSTANGAAVRIGDCRSFFNSHQLWGTR